MNCPNCNTFCPEGTSSCPNCGTGLINTEPVIQTPVTNAPAAPMPEPVTNAPAAPMPTVNTNEVVPPVSLDAPIPSVNTGIPTPKKERKPLPIKKIAMIGVPIAGVILLVLIGNFIYKTFFFDAKLDFIKATYDLNQPILVMENDRYGYINSKGKYIVKPKYEIASSFAGNYAIACNDDDMTSCYIINRKGQEKIKIDSIYGVDILDNGNLYVDNVLYDSNFKQISPKNIEVITGEDGYFSFRSTDNKYIGFFNENGKITYKIKNPNGSEYIYLQVESGGVSDDFDEKYCRVNLDNEKYGIVNCETGKVVMDYVSGVHLSAEGNNIFEIVDEDYENKESLFIYKNKILYRGKNDLYYADGSKLVTMYDDDYDKSYIDIKTGKILDELPNDYDEDELDEWENYTGYKYFSCSNGVGLMNDTDIKLDCKWDSIYYFDLDLYKFLETEGKEYILTRKNDKTNLINLKNGDIVETFDSRYVDEYISTFITYEDTDTKYHIYNLVTGKELVHDDGNEVLIGTNYVIIDDGKTSKYYNANFKEIFTIED